MGRILHYAFVLFIIAAISAGILSFADKKTKGPIEKIVKNLEEKAVKDIFPQGEKVLENEKIIKNGVEYTPVYDKNSVKIGYIAKGSEGGYGGAVKYMIGITMDSKVAGLKIIEAKETPGLGDKILDTKWQKKWIGRDAEYKFNKSEDAFAGATISPRAVYSGVIKALKNVPIKNNIVENKVGDEVFPGSFSVDKKEMYSSENCKMYCVFDQSGKEMGCIVTASAQGYSGPIEYKFGLDKSGKITGLKIVSSSETAGKIDTPEVEALQKKWIGKDVNYQYNLETDGVAGATASTTPIAESVTTILGEFEDVKTGKGWK